MPERKSQQSDTYDEVETEARREAALKRMLATPHKPHKDATKRRRPSAEAKPG